MSSAATILLYPFNTSVYAKTVGIHSHRAEGLILGILHGNIHSPMDLRTSLKLRGARKCNMNIEDSHNIKNKYRTDRYSPVYPPAKPHL
jgi:hypothetical protein